MRRIDPTLTEEALAKLGGHVGPTTKGERLKKYRPRPYSVSPLLAPRTNHLPVRRELTVLQRNPEV